MIMAYDTELGDKGFLDVDVDVEEGRLFLPGDKNSVLIGYDIAHQTDKYFDKEIDVKNSIYLDDEKFRVIGIFEKMGNEIDDRIYLPLEKARELFDQPDIVNAFVVKVADGLDTEKMADVIQRKLERKRGDDDFDIFTPAQLLEQFNQILGVVKAVLAGIAAISLFVGGLGIMNSMFTSVLERTREIGVMKAVGARNSDIMIIFMIESGLIGMIGGVIGVSIGVTVAFMVEYGAKIFGFTLLNIKIDIFLVLFGILFAFIVGMISGLIPAIRAAMLKPVDALRYE